MKIALLLCGQTRTFLRKEVLELQNNFINHYDTDVFVSTWDNVGISLYDLYKKEHFENKSKVNEDSFDGLKNLKSLKISNFEKFVQNTAPSEKKNRMINYLSSMNTGINSYNPHRFATSYPQLFTMYDANNLKKDYERTNSFTYDVVIKSRPDFIFLKNIDTQINNINNSVKSINSKPTYYFPNRIFDIMFISSSKNMDKITEAYIQFDELVKLNSYEKFKLNYGNTIAGKLEKIIKSSVYLKGLESYDCNRILYKQAVNNSINVDDIDTIIGELVKVEDVPKISEIISQQILI